MDSSDFQLLRLGSEYVYRGHISKIALLQLYYVIKITTFYGVSNSAGHTHAFSKNCALKDYHPTLNLILKGAAVT